MILKKFLAFILLFCLFNLISPISSLASDSHNYCKIIKSGKKYSLVDKSTKETILPPEYNRINKFKYEDNIIYTAEKNNSIVFYSPGGFYDNFLENYYSGFSNIKFENYPKNGSIIYSQKFGQSETRYGIINVENGIITITQPIFAKISFSDENSLIAKKLKISYAPLYDIIGYSGESNCFVRISDYLKETGLTGYCGKDLLEKSNIYENIEIKNGMIYSRYENSIHPEEKPILSINPVKSKGNITFDNNFGSGFIKFSSVQELYDFFEKNLNAEFINYPENIMLLNGNKLEITENGESKTLLYRNFNLNGKNSLFNRLTGLNVSFQNPDNIIAEKNNRWGVIDRNNNVIIPFEYNGIEPFNFQILEKITVSEGGKFKLEFIENKGDDGLFIARKNLYNSKTHKQKIYYYLIDSENNIISSYESISPEDTEDMLTVKQQTAKKNEEKIKAQRRKQLPVNILMFTADILFLPFYLIYPDMFNIHGTINYFGN